MVGHQFQGRLLRVAQYDAGAVRAKLNSANLSESRGSWSEIVFDFKCSMVAAPLSTIEDQGWFKAAANARPWTPTCCP